MTNQLHTAIENQALLLILLSEGKRVAMPVDAPLVYALSESNTLEGGAHVDLATQIVEVLAKKLKVDEQGINYLRGNFYGSINTLD